MMARFASGVLLAGAALAGCGYTTQSVWRADVKTIAVPVFENRSLRRGHEFELTKAVQNELMKRTGYTIAAVKDADTVLTGEISDFRTPVLVEDSLDRVFEYTVTVTMKLVWQDQRTGDILFEGKVTESGDAVLRRGQTIETARDEAFRELAQAVVNRLLKDW